MDSSFNSRRNWMTFVEAECSSSKPPLLESSRWQLISQPRANESKYSDLRRSSSIFRLDQPFPSKLCSGLSPAPLKLRHVSGPSAAMRTLPSCSMEIVRNIIFSPSSREDIGQRRRIVLRFQYKI